MKRFFIFIFASLLILVVLGLVFSKRVSRSEEEIDQLYAADASWPSVKYATVKAYLYNFDDPKPDALPIPDVLKDGKLVSSVVDKKGVELSPKQIQRLIAAIGRIPPHKFGVMTISSSMCIFDPHHAFVFYDSAGTPVATVEICLLCHQVEVWPTRKQYYEHDFDEIDSLCKEMSLPVFHTHEEFEAYRKKL